MNWRKKRTPGKTPPIVIVSMFGFVFLIIILAVAFGSGSGEYTSPPSRGNTTLPGGEGTSLPGGGGEITSLPSKGSIPLPSGGGTPSLGLRDTPSVVNDRVIVALKNDDAQALFDETDPSLQIMFPLDSLQKAQQESISILGKTLKVEVIQAPILLDGPEWNNQWAESIVRITREKGTKDYIVRYYQENGEWYLIGTIEK